MDNIDHIKKQLLRQMRETRERVPEDVLDRARQIAETQLKVQQQSRNSSDEKDEKIFWSDEIDFSRFPKVKASEPSQVREGDVIYYDRQAAKNVVEHFFSKFDKAGKMLLKLKTLMAKKS